MHKHTKRVLSLVLSLLLLVSLVPTSVLAAVDYNHDSSPNADGYYNVVSKKDWSIAPGIEESEIVLNNDLGTRRQVAHVMVADTTNKYVKVTTSYTNMDTSVFATSDMMQQATSAINNLGWNVVGAMNTCLSWYTGYPAEHFHEPLGYMMIDGETVWDLTQKYGSLGFPTCVVIYSDERPDGMPKVEMKSITGTQDLNGYEEQVIPCSSGYIVRDGVSTASSIDHDPQNKNSAPRSVVGVTADGKVIMMENDGRQSISVGMTTSELAELMIDLGCVYACNCDGGGSSTFLSKRPGAELACVNSPSDGTLRETTSGIMFTSTAPSDGQFALAHISSEDKYYTPGSSVTFSAIGTDLAGNAADIPADAAWQIKEAGMGAIDNAGVFTSNGTTGTVTAQMVYDGDVVGEASIEIVIPEIDFTTTTFSVKYGTSAELTLLATTNNGVNEVVTKPGDYVITCNNADIGTINGTTFTAVDAENAPENKQGTLTASLSFAPEVTATTRIVICPEITETLFSFDGQSDDWTAMEISGEGTYAWYGKNYILSDSTAEDGQVRYGDGSMKLLTNQLNAKILTNGGSKDYYQLVLMPKESIVLNNVQSYGVWVYLEDEMYAHEFNLRYIVDANNDGVFDTIKSYSPIASLDIYQKQAESGWYYLKVDVGGKNIMLAGADINSRDDVTASLKSKALPMNCRTIHIMGYPPSSNAVLRSGATVNGKYSIFFDNFTVDYAADVADRTAPEFGNITLLSSGGDDVVLPYGRSKNDAKFLPLAVTDTADNTLDITANVSDAGDGLNGTTAKAFVDGKQVTSNYANGKISIANIPVAQGIHRVKFEIADRAGNKQVALRLVNVTSAADASTIIVEPKDATLDRIACGSVYWMDLKATDIETIQSVSATIDMNSGNHWELAHAELADGFTYTYDVNEDTNTADITITRTGINTQTGEAVLASLPIRVISFDDDIQYPGKDATTYWQDTTLQWWPHTVAVDVDYGEIEYVADYDATTIGTFSNESFSVDTEMYMAQNYMIADDNDYFTTHGSLHVHNTEPLDDKPATCTEDGYSGRTFCEECNSVVDWGTTMPATGHSFDESVDGLQTCSNCGAKAYYADGEAQTGWIEIDDAIYYGKSDGTLADGKYTIDGHTYTFTDCVLTEGAWETDAEGFKICFWAGEQCHDGWYTMNGKKYHFHSTIADTGVCRLGKGVGGYEYRVFDEETAEWLENYNGLFIASNGVTYAENGIAIYYGLARSDAGDYYYINSKLVAVTNCTYSISEGKANGLLPAGKYQFGADGKMIDPPVIVPTEEPTEEPSVEPTDAPAPKNGLTFDDDGEIRFYVDNEPVYYGLAKSEAGDYYYINSSKKAVKSCTYGISEAKANGLLPAGKYEFGADGKMIIPIDYYLVGTVNDWELSDEYKFVKNTAAEGNEYILSDVALSANDELKVEDSNGAWYPDNADNYKVAESGVYNIYFSPVPVNNDGWYYGYFYLEKQPEPKNGLSFDEDGEIRYYVDDQPVYYGLAQSEAGDYYYINSSKKAVKNCTYGISEAKANGLMPAGKYQFGEDGKMIIPVDYYLVGTFNNWQHDIDYKLTASGDLYVMNDVILAANAELKVHGSNDVWYPANADNYVVQNAGIYNISFSPTPVDGIDWYGGYIKVELVPQPKNGLSFDDDGEIRYYVNDVPVYYGLAKSAAGDYYYINSSKKAVKDCIYGISTAKTNDLLPAGKYQFDADGKMIDPPVIDPSEEPEQPELKQGLVFDSDGEIRYYVDGTPVYYGLVENDGDYYYINSAKKAVKNCTYSVSAAKTNDLMPAGKYQFDADGKMILN